jgi:hypothetical protein
VESSGSSCDFPFFLKAGGRRLGQDRVKVFLGFLFLLPPLIAKLPPPLKIQCSMVFIGKVLLGFQISPSTFLSFSFPLFFFVNFDFS